MWEGQSTTTLSFSEICGISAENSETQGRWRCWRADGDSETLDTMPSNGLWSVNI